jgi:secreted Zn-dependent insulinase-like peptidase
MDENTFNDYKKSLIKFKTDKFKTQKEEADHYYTEISLKTYEFDRRFEEAKILESFTKNEVIQLYQTYLKKDAPKRKKFSSWMNSFVPPPVNDNYFVDPSYINGFYQITDINHFRSVHQFYPNSVFKKNSSSNLF